VHKELLKSYSEYFASAFSGKFAEGKKACIKLPKASEPTFRLFLQWLHAQPSLSALLFWSQ
jgi:hypothetical protein